MLLEVTDQQVAINPSIQCHLFLQVSQGFKRQYNNSQNHFLLIREVEDSKPPRFDETMDTLRMAICLMALVAMVGLSASSVLDLLPASMIAVLLIVSTKVRHHLGGTWTDHYILHLGPDH